MRLTELFLLAILLIPAAHAEQPFLADRNTIQVDVLSTVGLRATLPDYSVDYVRLNISFAPQESESQQILEFTPGQNMERRGNSIIATWNQPSPGELQARAKYTLEIGRWQPKIRGKAEFPIANVPADIVQFLQPTAEVDSSSIAVIQKASELAEGEDDLYEVVFKIANWTQHNIEYNLSTLTADVSQNASWVLSNRQGVCDELTTLFIAMLRSVGIPARFASGMAYTDSPLFPDNWGAHGWAEVYFGEHGWVPFDVTYGQFGYLDSTHIKAADGVDSEHAPIGYSTESRGRGVLIETREIEIKPGIVSSSDRAEPDVALSISLLQPEVGFGSYNSAEVTVKNLRDYYVAVELTPSHTTRTESDEATRHLLLGPEEAKKQYFHLKVDEDLDSKFIYTFPVSVRATGNVSAIATFTAASDERVYQKSELSSLEDNGIEGKTLLSRISASCAADKPAYYTYETANVNCTVRNTGNTYLRDMGACITKCHKLELLIGQARTVTDNVSFSSPGQKTIRLKVSNLLVSETATLTVKVLDEPKLRITGIRAPEEVDYGQDFNLTFRLEKSSSSNAYKSQIKINGKKIEGNRTGAYIVPMKGSDLNEGLNLLEITAAYEDANGKEYTENQQATVTLRKLSLIQKILLFFRRAFGP